MRVDRIEILRLLVGKLTTIHIGDDTAGVMVSALGSGSNGPGTIPGQGRWVVFWRTTLYSLNPIPTKCMHSRERGGGGIPSMDLHPIQGEKKYC